MRIAGAVVGAIIFVGAITAVIASAFLLIHWRAVRNSRRLGLPSARRTAAFVGGMLSGTSNAGSGPIRLELFDWGIRLRGASMLRLFTPVREGRYDELTEARLVTAPANQRVRLRAADSAHPVLF